MGNGRNTALWLFGGLIMLAILGAADTFIELEDTPSSYESVAPFIILNSTQDGLEFTANLTSPYANKSAIWFEETGNIIIYIDPILEQKTYSAEENGIEINGTDSECTTGLCWIEFSICNKNLLTNNLDLAFKSPLLQSNSVYLKSTYINQANITHNSRYTTQEFTNKNKSWDYVTTEIYNWTEQINTTKEIWNHLTDLTTTTKTYKQFESKQQVQLAPGCYELKMPVINQIGGNHKYDISFLDPEINATHYEIGNVSRQTSNWSVDHNSTASNVTIASDSLSFTGTSLDLDVPDAHYKFDNDYTDSGTIGTDLTSKGAGNSFDSGDPQEGTHHLDSDGASYADHGGTGFATGHFDFTVAFWVKENSYDNWDQVWSMGDIDTGSEFSRIGIWSDGEYYFGIGTTNFETNYNPTVGWDHLAIVYHSGNKSSEFFVNGSYHSAFTHSGTPNIDYTGGIFAISAGDAGGAPVDADFDDFRYYEQSLSHSNITDIYNGGGGYQEGTYRYQSNHITLTNSQANVTPSWHEDTDGQTNSSIHISCDGGQNYVQANNTGQLIVCEAGTQLTYYIDIETNSTTTTTFWNMSMEFTPVPTPEIAKFLIKDDSGNDLFHVEKAGNTKIYNSLEMQDSNNNTWTCSVNTTGGFNCV